MAVVEVRETGGRKQAPAVLVVDDDAACREAVCNTLKQAGYVALEACDGKHALRILLANEMPEPTVILLDIWLPVMSGPDLLKVLRTYHRLSRIPVILTSGGPPYSCDSTMEAAWLAKPFEEDLLLSVVRECCAAVEERLVSERTEGWLSDRDAERPADNRPACEIERLDLRRPARR
jgi:CheY-like chemotaxis protein